MWDRPCVFPSGASSAVPGFLSPPIAATVLQVLRPAPTLAAAGGRVSAEPGGRRAERQPRGGGRRLAGRGAAPAASSSACGSSRPPASRGPARGGHPGPAPAGDRPGGVGGGHPAPGAGRHGAGDGRHHRLPDQARASIWAAGATAAPAASYRPITQGLAGFTGGHRAPGRRVSPLGPLVEQPTTSPSASAPTGISMASVGWRFF